MKTVKERYTKPTQQEREDMTMTTKYFTNCETIEDVKKTYKRLACKLHPDNGGSAEEFTQMSKEYEKAFERLKNTFRNVEGEKYQKENTETASQFKDIIDKIIHFENVKIEIIGTWIWVSGDTRPYKDILKALHFNWCKNKTAWSFHSEPWKKRTNTKTTLDDIRNLYGSEEIHTQTRTKLA